MNKKEVTSRIQLAIMAVITFIGIGTVLFHSLEDWTWIQAFYFSVVSMTTVGYGDLAPSNDLTRLVVAIYVLISVAIMLTTLGMIGNAIIERGRRKYLDRRAE